MYSNSFTQKDRIIKSKVSLNSSHPFFAYILMQMCIEQSSSSETCPSMAIDAYGNLYWNEDFTSTLTESQLNAVLAHEAMHVCTLTFDRKGSRDMMLWNIATDLIINTLLKADNFDLPKDCILPDKNGDWTFTGAKGKKFTIKNVIDKTAEEVYDIINTHAEQIKINMCGDGDGEGHYRGSFDSHIDNSDESEADSKANSEKWKKIAVEAATNAKQRGKGSSIYDRILGQLLEPEIDWRAQLSQFITKDLPVDFTMRRPGRKYYSSGIYYPSIIRENLNVIVGIDVSGSISQQEYDKFMSEVIGIASSFDQINMRVIWWSTKVLDGDDIEITKMNTEEVTNHKFKSTGGTEMSCFAQYCKKNNINSNIYVILTDGCVEGKPEVPDGQIMFVMAGEYGTDDIIKNYGPVCKLKLDKN